MPPPGAPRLDGDEVPVGELAHVELARGRALLRAVGAPVDHQAAGAADALPAVRLEGDGFPAFEDEAFVEHVQHLQERGVGADASDVVGLEPAGVAGTVLAPDAQAQVQRAVIGGAHL